MSSTKFDALEIANNSEAGVASNHEVHDMVALHRFMIWAYEENKNTLNDAFLEASIRIIICYLGKHYNLPREKLN